MNELTATPTTQPAPATGSSFNILDVAVGVMVFTATGLILRALKVKKNKLLISAAVTGGLYYMKSKKTSKLWS